MFLRSFIVSAIFFTFVSNAFASWDFFAKKRDYIYLVGSSTISPLMAAVAEEFSRSKAASGAPIQTPIVESSGSVAGFKAFCLGVGSQYPDFVNASRAMEKSEIENCYKNGVRNIGEIKIGYDGIVIANAKNAKKLDLNKEQIFAALAEKIYDYKSKSMIKNPYKFWDEIDRKLPHMEIVFYGPPASSATRDVFIDMIMETTCMEKAEIIGSFSSYDEMKKQCHKIRNDGVFIASGENDDNILRSLRTNNNALGIFGFNFLVVNPDKIQPVKIDGQYPTYETISSKKYDLSRPLFVYFKKDHLDLIPQMRDFIHEIINAETIGQKGYLVHNGLVPQGNAELLQLKKEILPQLK